MASNTFLRIKNESFPIPIISYVNLHKELIIFTSDNIIIRIFSIKGEISIRNAEIVQSLPCPK